MTVIVRDYRTANVNINSYEYSITVYKKHNGLLITVYKGRTSQSLGQNLFSWTKRLHSVLIMNERVTVYDDSIAMMLLSNRWSLTDLGKELLVKILEEDKDDLIKSMKK